VGLVAGLLIGIFLRSAGLIGSMSPVTGALDVIGSLWIDGIRMTVLPLVMALMVAAVARPADQRNLGRLGLNTALWLVLLLGASAAATAVLAPPLFDRVRLDAAATAALRASAAGAGSLTGDASLRSWLISLVPANVFKAAADGSPLPLIVFAILFGAAAARAEPALRERVVVFAQSVRDVMLIIVRWVLWLAPLGVFAIGVTLGAALGRAVFDAVFYFMLVTSLGALLIMLALYPVVAVFGRAGLGRFARAAAPAQIVAAGTRSSLASLPAMLEGARGLGLKPEVADFVLPLTVSVFKLSVPLYWIASSLTIARLYGIHLGVEQIALVALASVFMSPTVPGIPNGGTIAMAPVLAMIGLPAAGLAVAIALESLPDILYTMTNVTGDFAIATILGGKEGKKSAAQAP
jgi:Na+/H+-dicarboxylate symporter